MSEKVKAKVCFENKLAGILCYVEGIYTFKYNLDYLTGGGLPIAYSLPLSIETYESDMLFPFFEGLLSEGWLRDIQCRTQKVDKKNLLKRLILNGRDMVGAVSIIGENDEL